MAKKTGSTKWRRTTTPRALKRVSDVFKKTFDDLGRKRDTYRKEIDENIVFELTEHDSIKLLKQHEKVARWIKENKGKGKKIKEWDAQLKEMDIPAVLDHNTLQPLSQKLAAQILTLQANMQNTPPSDIAYDPTLNKKIAELQRLKAMNDAINKHYKSGGLEPGDVSKLVHKLPLNDLGQLELNKQEKVTPNADGKVWSLQVMGAKTHEMKNWAERRIGVKASETIFPDWEPDQTLLKEANKLSKMMKKQGMNIVGSKDLYSVYRDGYFAVFGGKGNFKRYQAGRKIKLGSRKQNDFVKSKNKLRKIAIQAGIAKATWKEAAAAHSPKKETEHGNIAKELIKIRNKVNRKLPKEIQENMGRPALINRTGRFANSAVLADLRPSSTGKTVMAKYTYMLNPYQTFENTGIRKWPTGFNPKPLISRSIRNLAEKETREKFGIGITTRRI